jgi:hypothetical protein
MPLQIVPRVKRDGRADTADNEREEQRQSIHVERELDPQRGNPGISDAQRFPLNDRTGQAEKVPE